MGVGAPDVMLVAKAIKELVARCANSTQILPSYAFPFSVASSRLMFALHVGAYRMPHCAIDWLAFTSIDALPPLFVTYRADTTNRW